MQKIKVRDVCHVVIVMTSLSIADMQHRVLSLDLRSRLLGSDGPSALRQAAKTF